MKPRLLRLSYVLWTIVPVALFGLCQLFGLPHVIWSYEFQGSRTDFASRHYTRCTFIGPYGAFTVPATDGRCGWLLFHKGPETAR